MGCRHSRVYPSSSHPGHRLSSNPTRRTSCPSPPAERGRVSACSYRSFEDNDDLDPVFAPRPSSSLHSATPECSTRLLPGVALVTPRGTFHRWGAGNGHGSGQALGDPSRPVEGRRAARQTARSSGSQSSQASSGLYYIPDDVGVFQYFAGSVLPYRNRVALVRMQDFYFLCTKYNNDAYARVR